MVAYKLGNTFRNKLLNCEQTTNSISVDEEVAFSLKN